MPLEGRKRKQRDPERESVEPHQYIVMHPNFVTKCSLSILMCSDN